MTPDFEAHRSEWSLRVTRREVVRIGVTMSAIGRPAADGIIAWVTKTAWGTRLWIIRRRSTLFWLTADAAPSDPAFALPLPALFIDQIMNFIQMNDEEDDDGEDVELFANEEQNVIVARSGGRYICIDHPMNPVFTPSDIPYLQAGHDTPVGQSVATVQMSDLRLFIDSCTTVPGRTEIDVYPHVSLALGNNALAWTMDWRRFGQDRLTAMIPAVTRGEGSASFFPWTVARCLCYVDPESQARVFIDGASAEYVYFVGDDWGIREVNATDEAARWTGPLIDALWAAGCATADDADPPVPAMVDFVLDDLHECHALILRSDPPGKETVRLAYVVATNVEPNEDVLAEINAVNDSLIGGRVTLRDRRVTVMVDFPCSELDSLSRRVDDLRRAVNATAGLDVFLPLFSQ